MWKRVILTVGILVLLLESKSSAEVRNKSEEKNTVTEEILDNIEFDEIDRSMENSMLSFREIVTKLLQGEQPLSADKLKDVLFSLFWGEIDQNRKHMIYLSIIIIFSALFINFSHVLPNAQVSENSFYIFYLLMIMELMQSFLDCSGVVSDALLTLMDFMNALVPSYLLTVTFANGSLTAGYFYEVVLLVIFLVERVFLKALLPLIKASLVIGFFNFLSKEDILSALSELFGTIVKWAEKSLFALVLGVNVVQGMVSPASDAIKRQMAGRAAEAIPGIGTTIHSVTDIMIGSGMVIKSVVGGAALVVLVIICLIPVFKLVVIYFMYKLLEALFQPIMDRRLQGGLKILENGIEMLMGLLILTMALFFITVAVVTRVKM